MSKYTSMGGLTYPRFYTCPDCTSPLLYRPSTERYQCSKCGLEVSWITLMVRKDIFQ